MEETKKELNEEMQSEVAGGIPIHSRPGNPSILGAPVIIKSSGPCSDDIILDMSTR